MPLPNGSIPTRVRIGLLAQAVVTGGLALGPLASGSLAAGRWLPLVGGAAAGAAVLAGFVGTRTRSAWTMTIGFELLAIAVGVAGFLDAHYVPGTAVAVAVLVQLALPAGRAAFPAIAAVAPMPVRLTPPPVIPAPRGGPPTMPPPPLSAPSMAPPAYAPPTYAPPGSPIPPVPAHAATTYQPPLGGTILPGR